MKSVYQACIMLMILTIVSGIIYPAIITGIGQLFWPDLCNGSLIKRDQVIIGSELIAQKFTSPEYFWPRPSACDYNAVPSGASNLGPTSATLAKQIETRRKSYTVKEADPIPDDLLTASGSGLDPHISEAAAKIQINRIVRARNLGENGVSVINDLIDKQKEHRQLAILGEERVNVLLLNLALDRCCKKSS